MDLKNKYSELIARANELKNTDMSDEELKEFSDTVKEAEEVKAKISERAAAENILAGLKGAETATPEVKSRTMGGQFIDRAADSLPGLKKNPGVVNYEIKANPALTPADIRPFATDYDTNVVTGKRDLPCVADLFSQGEISGTAISYIVEGDQLAGFGETAEGALKNKLDYEDPTPVVEYLSKITGYLKVSLDYIDDFGFMKTEIDNRLRYDLRTKKDNLLLSGTGQLKGVMNREGVQVKTAENQEKNADAVFQAMTAISTATDLQADGIILNPADYEAFRLAKDSNGQYFGGGFFAGAYGAVDQVVYPNIWGLNTVVTTAIDKGTALIGAFRTGATLYTKGGIRVQVDTSGDDFIHNLATVLAEERLALAVRKPAAFVKLTLGAAA